MVPQDDAMVPNPVADTPVETPAKTFEEDTDAVVSRTHSDFLLTSIGAKVAAVPFMWAFNIFAGAGLIFTVNTYNMDDKKTALTQVSDICLSVGFVIAMLGTSFALGRVTAAGGQLELLGAGDSKISERSYRALRRSHAWMLVGFVLFATLGLLCIVTATRVGGRSKLTGRLITESYAIALFFGGLVFLIVAVTTWPVWLTLKMASVLVADAVSETRKKIERHTPASAEWELEVMPSVLGLCIDTLPQLSNGWGAAVATTFVGWWLLAIAWFAAFLEGGAYAAALITVLCILVPIAMVYDAASASSDCDGISDALTHKRMNGPNDDLMHAHAIRKVELILDRQNTKQGLGFVVDNRVVDLKTLSNILATIFGVGSTVVPILFSLRPDTEGDALEGALEGECELTALQTNAIRGLAGLFNSSCNYNISITDVLAE